MGSWNFSNIGFSCINKNVERVKEVLECMGIDFDDSRDSEDGVINEMFLNIVEKGCNHSDFKPLEIYLIVNNIYNNTTIFFETEEGNNTSDWYSRHEEIYNPNTNKIMVGEYNYCVGEGEDKEINKWVENIKNVDICEESIIGIIDNAAQKGYNELVEQIITLYKLNYVSPYKNKTEKKPIQKKPSREHLNEAGAIDNLNHVLEKTSFENIFCEFDQTEIERLKDDDVIDLEYYSDMIDEPDLFVQLSHNGIKIASLFNRAGYSKYVPSGVHGAGGLVYTWATIKKNQNGNHYLKYEYRFLDLDYASIRKAIIDLLNSSEYKNGKMEDCEITDIDEDEIDDFCISNNNMKTVSKKSVLVKPSKFNNIVRGYELNILNIAKNLGIDCLQYDLNDGFIPQYVDVYDSLMNELGNNIQLVAGIFSSGISISGLNIGDTLQLFLEEDKYHNKNVVVKKEDVIVGYIHWDMIDFVSEFLINKKIETLAEVIEITPEPKKPDKGEVYVKIKFTEI